MRPGCPKCWTHSAELDRLPSLLELSHLGLLQPLSSGWPMASCPLRSSKQIPSSHQTALPHCPHLGVAPLALAHQNHKQGGIPGSAPPCTPGTTISANFHFFKLLDLPSPMPTILPHFRPWSSLAQASPRPPAWPLSLTAAPPAHPPCNPGT